MRTQVAVDRGGKTTIEGLIRDSLAAPLPGADLPGDVTLLQTKRASSVCNGVPQLKDCLHSTYSAKPQCK